VADRAEQTSGVFLFPIDLLPAERTTRKTTDGHPSRAGENQSKSHTDTLLESLLCAFKRTLPVEGGDGYRATLLATNVYVSISSVQPL